LLPWLGCRLRLLRDKPSKLHFPSLKLPVVRSTHFRFSSFLLSITILPSARPVPNSTAPDCPQQSPDSRAFSELRRGASSLVLCLGRVLGRPFFSILSPPPHHHWGIPPSTTFHLFSPSSLRLFCFVLLPSFRGPQIRIRDRPAKS
jgi:hypothetical protein